jgi:hypothetical protein
MVDMMTTNFDDAKEENDHLERVEMWIYAKVRILAYWSTLITVGTAYSIQ